MAAQLPYFDYDKLADDVRGRLRLALRDDEKLAAAVTFGEGEAFVSNVSGAVAEQVRRRVQAYQTQIEAILEGIEAAAKQGTVE